MGDTTETESEVTQENVWGDPIEECSHNPVTGFFRDGCCRTDATDVGQHTVCAQMTADFLAFSKSQGNDLSTPRPEFGFAGLKPGDQWCLCAARWLDAFNAGKAPSVRLAATNIRALEVIPIEALREHALDMQ